MDEALQKEIVDELKVIKKLLAQNLISGKKQIDQIYRLDSIGFKPKEIAEILNTTAHTVSVALHKMRKSKKNRSPHEESDS